MTDTPPGLARAAETADAVAPLRSDDPPALGHVRLHGRLRSDDAGSLMMGKFGDRPVVVAWLGAGAETDTYARARFVDAATTLADAHPGLVVAEEDDPGLAPWVALDGHEPQALAYARRLLDAVALVDPDAATGDTPDFRPHWWSRAGLGRWRIWPLPWPRAMHGYPGWTYLLSALLIAALAALGLWIAALVLDEPPAGPRPPQPFPTTTPSTTQSTTSRPSTSTTRSTTPRSTTTRSTSRSTTTVPPVI